jgi:hypothetical protein
VFLPDMVAAIQRRWYVVLAGFLGTVSVGLLAVHTPARYLATEVLVLKPPVSSYAPNPVTGLNPSLAVTAAAVANRLSTADSKAMFQSLGVTGTYTFEPRNTGTNQEPRYVISSMAINDTADSEKASLRSIAILADVFQKQLNELQDRWKVANDARIRMAVLVPAASTLLPHSAFRSLIGAGLLGVVVTLAAVFWTEDIARRRRVRAVDRPRRPIPAVAS